MNEIDAYNWLEAITDRIQELQEQTEKVEEENIRLRAELAEKRALNALNKLYEENDQGLRQLARFSVLSIDDIKDIHALLLTHKKWINPEKRLMHVVNCININTTRLIEKLETIINAQ